ncbi:hypothetical protein DFH09DRAFT_1230191 [Mycena vulgaris]|nr:hypothetical protein DFH09DRAFT_1230191 [Mycena vulgaris]
MAGQPQLCLPLVMPSADTISAFWRKISYLTTRTRTHDGRWIGSQEVKIWNAQNMETCDKCASSRNGRRCGIEEDQPSCRPCRNGKTACDRKIKFLFDSTCNEFFPTMELFVYVYNARDQKQCRTFQKTANKKRRAALPFGAAPKPRVVFGRYPAIALDNRLETIEEPSEQQQQINQILLRTVDQLRKCVNLGGRSARAKAPISEAEQIISMAKTVDDFQKSVKQLQAGI